MGSVLPKDCEKQARDAYDETESPEQLREYLGKNHRGSDGQKTDKNRERPTEKEPGSTAPNHTGCR